MGFELGGKGINPRHVLRTRDPHGVCMETHGRPKKLKIEGFGKKLAGLIERSLRCENSLNNSKKHCLNKKPHVTYTADVTLPNVCHTETLGFLE